MPVCQNCKIGVPPSYDVCPKCGGSLASPGAQAPTVTAPATAPEGASAYVTVAPPQPAATAAPATGRPGGMTVDVCSVCGRGPAIMLSLRRHMGLILLIRFAKLRAPFCRVHGEAAAREYLRRTLVEGWWGFLSFFLNWWAIYVDVRELGRARKLGPPTQSPDPQWTRQLPEDVTGAIAETPQQKAARGSVVATIAISIGLGVAAVIAVHLIAGDQTAALSRRIGIGTALTLGLYVIVALLVARQLAADRIRPHTVEGSASRALAIGLLAGGGAAAVLGILISLITGRLSSDPRIVGVIFEGRTSYVLATVFIAVVAAPIVEEVLFRGLLVESMRSRGRTAAVLGGAVAFSLWHLNPAALRYYVLLGVLLGFMYWRFGLAGSISAHAAFNGVLVALAFVAVGGGTTVVGPTGVGATLPGGWKRIDKTLGLNIDLAAESPVGAGFVVAHVKLFTPLGADMPQLPQADRVPPGSTNVRRISVAGTNAIEYDTAIRGIASQIALVPRGQNGYVVTMISGGSEKARSQFNAILSSLTLPSG